MAKAKDRGSVRSCLAWLAVVLLGFGVGSARAVDVSNGEDLRNAIIAANGAATSVTTTITFTNSFTLDRVLTPITGNITFEGNGYTISGGSGTSQFQIFFVDSGSTLIQDLVIADGLSRGGDGAGRGGGGLGAGGGLFVNTGATVTLRNVQFRNNTARGGNGGLDLGANLGGGGGGFHGNGGAAGIDVNSTGGGGGGGYNGAGGINGGGGGGLEGNGLPSSRATGVLFGGNGGGEFENGDGGQGATLGAGSPGLEFQGGGGGGTSGGKGGAFGGGGSAVGNAGDGGDFGGGGGSGGLEDGSDGLPGSGGRGGSGGFGGGGGGSSNRTVTEGGFGGGDGAIVGQGGAGSSLGGAIFVRSGVLLWNLDPDPAALTPVIVLDAFDPNAPNKLEAAAGSGQPAIAGDDVYLMSTATVAFATDLGAEVSGKIEGEGKLTKDGTGTLILSGSNSYSGGTDVMAGTLQGTTDSLQGAIAAQAGTVVRFDQDQATNGDGTYSGVLTGAGSLEKDGDATVRLTGNNTYTGTTTINAGVLSVTTASLPSDPSVSVMVNGSDSTLRFDQGSDGTFLSPIMGDGILDKQGSGTITLEGNSSGWLGGTTIRGGELSLALNASLGAGPGKLIDVQSGGRLGGEGSANGDVRVTGTLAPGTTTTPSVLPVGGNLDLLAGSVLEVDITDRNTSDRVAVLGTATLALDSVLSVLPAPGDYTTVRVYDVLTAGTLAAGPPANPNISVQSDFCFFTSGLSVLGNTLQLTLTPNLNDLADRCTETSNQRAVAAALQSAVGTGNPIFGEIIVLTEDQVPQALDAMGGEGLSGFGSARLAASTQFIGTLSNRMHNSGEPRPDAGPPYPLSFGTPLMPGLSAGATLSDPRVTTASLGGPVRMGAAQRKPSPFTFVSTRGESGLGGWLDGFATFAAIDGDGNSNDTDYNLYGTSGGVDYAFGDGAIVGAAFGYTRSKLSVSDLTTWGTGDTFQGAIYGAVSTQDFYVGGVARYAYSQMDSTRRITFGTLYEKANGEFDGSSISGYLEAGLASFELEEFWLQPMASFQYTYLDTEGFTETGAPSLNLNVQSESINSMITNLGLRVYRAFSMDGEGELIPELRVRWAHEFGDRDRRVRARFDDTPTSAPFALQGAEVGRDVAILGAGWTVVGEDNVSISLSYDATVNEDLVSHAVTVGVLIYW